MATEEVTSFFPDISVITDDKHRSEYSGPSPRNTNASCISAITFDDSDTVSSANRLFTTTSFSSENSKHFKSKDEPLSKRILGVYSTVKNDDSSSNSFHRMMRMVDALDTKTSSDNDSGHKSLSGKGSSLYSRILSGLQEMEVDKAPTDTSSTGNCEMVPEEQGDDVEEHYARTQNNCIKNIPKNSRGNSSSKTSDDKDGGDEEESIIEEIEEGEDEIDEHNLSGESTAVLQKCVTACSPLKKQENVSPESTKTWKQSMTTEDQQNEQKEEHSNNQEQEYQRDQWREVFDDRTGRTYYYNRRTRESRWDLPRNSIVVGRKLQVCSSPNRRQQTSVDYSLRDVSMSEIIASIEHASTGTMSNQDSLFSFQTMKSGQHAMDISSCNQPMMMKQRDDPQQQQQETSILSGAGGIASPNWHNDTLRSLHDENSNIQSHSPTKGNNSMKDSIQQELFNEDDAGMKNTRRHYFCMYCGTEVATANAMKQHLHLNCRHYSYMSQEDPEEHSLLQNILNTVWSATSYTSKYDQFVKESDKENHVPHFQQCKKIKEQQEEDVISYHQGRNNSNHVGLPDATSSQRFLDKKLNHNASMISNTSSSSVVQQNDRSMHSTHTTNNESVFTLSDEEDTLLDIDFYQHRKWYDKKNKKKRSSGNDKTPQPSPPASSPSRTPGVCSCSCAFCGKLFRSGDKFSRHLLLCKERQRSNKKRAPSNKNKETFAKVPATGTITSGRVTPPQGKTPSSGANKTNSIQSHLLTCSGRHLPGYPPITN
jgi:Splicing factor